MLRVTFLGRKWLWRSSQCAVCTVRDCGFVGCGRHDLRTSLESALLLSLSSQLRPLRNYIPCPLYSLATSLFFVITSYESTNALQSLNLSVFASTYSIAFSPFLDITSYQLTNVEIIRSRQLAETWEQNWRQRRGVVGEVKEFLGQSVTAMSSGFKKSNSFQWQYSSWQQNCPRCVVQFTSIRRSDNWQQWEGRGGLGGDEEEGGGVTKEGRVLSALESLSMRKEQHCHGECYKTSHLVAEWVISR